MESPQTQIWGPALWTILHSSAERIGTKSAKIQAFEEQRLWNGLLSSLRFSLPCPQCKKHFSDYLSSHPIHEVSSSFIRNWLYELHSQVNQRNHKDNSITIENIPEIYNKPFHFSYHVNIVMKHMKSAIFHRFCSREDIQRTARFFEEMKRFYDFF